MLSKILPDFEFLELEDDNKLENTYAVIGKDFVYGISEFENQEEAINDLEILFLVLYFLQIIN